MFVMTRLHQKALAITLAVAGCTQLDRATTVSYVKPSTNHDEMMADATQCGMTRVGIETSSKSQATMLNAHNCMILRGYSVQPFIGVNYENSTTNKAPTDREFVRCGGVIHNSGSGYFIPEDKAPKFDACMRSLGYQLNPSNRPTGSSMKENVHFMRVKNSNLGTWIGTGECKTIIGKRAFAIKLSVNEINGTRSTGRWVDSKGWMGHFQLQVVNNEYRLTAITDSGVDPSGVVKPTSEMIDSGTGKVSSNGANMIGNLGRCEYNFSKT